MDKYAKEGLDGLKRMVSYEEDHFTMFNFDEFSRVYPFTNECIFKQLGFVNLDINTRALTILSSGDHPFNLVCKGVMNIDTFDLNRLTDFYALGLKRSLIINRDYQEFLDFVEAMKHQKSLKYLSGIECKRNNEYIKQTIYDLTSSMDTTYRDFWRGVLDYFTYLESRDKDGDCIELFERITRGREDDITVVKENNNYASTPYMYNKLRRNLGNANIRYVPTSIFDLREAFKYKKYDFIALSNTLDYVEGQLGMYWGVSELEPFISDLKKLSSDGCTIFLHSILPRRGQSVKEESVPVFKNSAIYKSFLGDLEYQTLPCTIGKEAVVIKKVLGGQR